MPHWVPLNFSARDGYKCKLRTKRRKTQSCGAHRTKIVARDKPVASHPDARSGADPRAGATIESALQSRRCRNTRDSASADSRRGKRGRCRTDGCQFCARGDRDTARATRRQAEAQPASSSAVADRRGPSAAPTQFAVVHGLPLFQPGPAHISLLNDYDDARSRAFSSSATSASTSARRSTGRVGE